MIKVKENIRDLGVQLSSDLSFSTHIENIVISSSQLAGWALRTFRRRSRSIMLTIFKTLIQPKLDYCSQLYSPTRQELINKIESVQRHFTDLEHFDFWNRLRDLRLFSQERRRERYLILFVWKICQGKVSGYEMQFVNSDRRGRYAVPKTVVRSASSSVRRAREGSLGVRGAQLFNILPAHIRSCDATTIDAFKILLDDYLHTVPDQPTISGMVRATETNSLLHQIPLTYTTNLTIP